MKLNKNNTSYILLFAILLFLISCGKDTPVTPPNGETKKGSITGYLQAFSYTYVQSSRDTATMFLDELNGTKVYLVKDGKDVASTTTILKDYTFDSIAVGTYQARAEITPDIALTSAPKAVIEGTLSFFNEFKFKDYTSSPDTLMISFLWNNPFTNTGCDVYYTVLDPNMTCTMDIYNVKGQKMETTHTFKPDSQEPKITVGAGLPEGIYFVLLKSGKYISYTIVHRKG